MTESNQGKARGVTRREFIGGGTAAGLMILKPGLVRGTAANSAVRVGLLGCGGRGTEDATNLIDTGHARVVALADLFPDQLQKVQAYFDHYQQAKGYAAIDRAQMFVGASAFEQIAGSKGVDAVVIATPPYFHPQHLAAVVEAGKHVYCEKPVAVDVDGARTVIETGRRAEGRLSLEVGFQIRKAPPFVELVRRIHGGALGAIACGEIYYFGTYLDRPAWPNASPVERRIRNWVRDRVLSGDIIVEQNIHIIDITNWVLEGHPVKAAGAGGHPERPKDDGDAYGHYNVVFTYPNDVHVSLNSTQFDKGWWDVSERFFGSKGVSVSPYSGTLGIYGDEPWTWQPPGPPAPAAGQFSATGSFSDNLAQADPEKKKAFIESVTSGRFHNQAEVGAESALSAMLGRTAAYEGREVTWDELARMDMKWESGIDLTKLA